MANTSLLNERNGSYFESWTYSSFFVPHENFTWDWGNKIFSRLQLFHLATFFLLGYRDFVSKWKIGTYLNCFKIPSSLPQFKKKIWDTLVNNFQFRKPFKDQLLVNSFLSTFCVYHSNVVHHHLIFQSRYLLQIFVQVLEWCIGPIIRNIYDWETIITYRVINLNSQDYYVYKEIFLVRYWLAGTRGS